MIMTHLLGESLTLHTTASRLIINTSENNLGLACEKGMDFIVDITFYGLCI